MAIFKALFILFCLLSSTSFAQTTNLVDGKGIDLSTNNLWGNVQEINLKDYSVKHEQQYLQDAWTNGIIYVKGGAKIDGFDLRYDLVHEELELRARNIIKVLPLFRADSFIWVTPAGVTQRFQSALYYKNTFPLTGFFEIISAGSNWSLYKKYQTVVLEPNYNAALNVGSTQAKTKINEIYYFFNGEQLVEVGTSLKSFIKQLPVALQDPMKDFIRQYKLNLRNEFSLLEIKSFLNR